MSDTKVPEKPRSTTENDDDPVKETKFWVPRMVEGEADLLRVCGRSEPPSSPHPPAPSPAPSPSEPRTTLDGVARVPVVCIRPRPLCPWSEVVR